MTGPNLVSDIESLGHTAGDKAERRLALDACLTGQWIEAEIVKIEREDSTNWNGWRMWEK
jgi:hypothetical protein